MSVAVEEMKSKELTNRSVLKDVEGSTRIVELSRM